MPPKYLTNKGGRLWQENGESQNIQNSEKEF